MQQNEYFVAFSNGHKKEPGLLQALVCWGWKTAQNIFAKVEVIALPAVSSVGTVYTAVEAIDL